MNGQNLLSPNLIARQAVVTRALFVLLLSLFTLLTVFTVAGLANVNGTYGVPQAHRTEAHTP